MPSNRQTDRILKSEDLRWLACPVCHSSLALEAGSVRCTGCTRSYPVADGIPVLLASRGKLDARFRF
ncbi:MAG TPA: Trm112 family protein [Acidobacteriaceae bacterium]|nr:Trm112 family protein [Acidobacteriaceae bacterium]